LEWGLYFYSMKILGRVSFELETLAFLLCSVGIMLLCGEGVKTTYTQLLGVAIGTVLYCFLIWFLGSPARVMRWRVAAGVLAMLLFAANLLLAKEHNGARNWITLGPFSLQPSELIKIAFILVGASTLDRL
ncbi:MAG TPA: hypothetical protein DD737_09130, partial [Ruminococcaceae bacterium]|nr:hypothetical protein [Oscillospiraceae bacterium]